jgi:hypothetical protein
MKFPILNISVILLIAAAATTGCSSASENQQSANITAGPTETAPPNNTAQTVAVPDSITKAEWEEFKSYSESVIQKNEATIEDLKLKMKDSGKSADSLYVLRINTLEQNNKDMKRRISDYEKDQSNWSTFKREFNHDMDALGNALKDLSKDNKK